MSRFILGWRVALVVVAGWGVCGSSSVAAKSDRGTVSGVVQFEKVTNRNPWTGVAGLQVQRPVLRAVVGAKVELIDADKKVLATGLTGAKGEYRLKWVAAEAPMAEVRVYAIADNVTVADHYNPNSIYAVSSKPWQMAEGPATKDIVADDKSRASGPFNIMAVVQMANRFIREVEPDVTFKPIRMRWTTRLREGTTYFTRGAKSEIFVLGYRPVDSDEFDDFIVLHEYGHYLQHHFSKDDSPGGDHSGTQRFEPRLAFSEGWASYFACAALDDPRYMDTGTDVPGTNGVRVQYDVSKATKNDNRAGPWSDFTVSSTLWAVSQKRPGTLGLGFGPVWKTFRSDAWKERGPYRQLIDFCDILVAGQPEIGPRFAKILEARNITYMPGKTPSVPEPYVRALPAGEKVEGEVNSIGRVGSNAYEARAVYTFKVTKKSDVKLHLDIVDTKVKGQDDLDLWLFHANGQPLKSSAKANGVGDSETIEMQLNPGVYYVEVRSFGPGRGKGGRGRLGAASYQLTAEYE